MKGNNYFKNKTSLYIKLIFICLFDVIYFFDISSLKMNYFMKDKNYIILIPLIMIKEICTLNIGVKIMIYDIL